MGHKISKKKKKGPHPPPNTAVDRGCNILTFFVSSPFSVSPTLFSPPKLTEEVRMEVLSKRLSILGPSLAFS